MNKLILVAIMSGLLACTEKQNKSYQFYDSHPYAAFLERLDQEKIKYTPKGKFGIAYAENQNEKVMAIVEQVMAQYYAQCGGGFQDERKQMALKKLLKKSRVPFNAVHMDDGEKLLCPEEYTDKFSSAYRSVLRGYR